MRRPRALVAMLVAAVVAMAFVGAAQAAAPDADMLAAPERLARFLETRDATGLSDAFTATDVTILENFPPHLFRGPGAVAQWRDLMRQHIEGVGQLRHVFGAAEDFVRTDDTVFFTLPTVWTGVEAGKPFTEHGGWSFVLVREDGAWRIRAYGWAVVNVAD